MPRSLIERAQELATVIGTTPGVRLEPLRATHYKAEKKQVYGTPYTTGQKPGEIQFCIDLLTLMEVHVAFITQHHGARRAARFREWAGGRRWNSFNWRHRILLRIDREKFIEMLLRGKYVAKSD